MSYADRYNLDPDKIMQLVRQKGEFVVTWHYRNDRLRRTVSKLCKEKKLWCKSNCRGKAVYILHKELADAAA
jgi:hypothetical protein